ncbi:MAG: hypothetical protein JXA07_02810 [Spirochaetes bacterium]|nr:hypothetical protein [Spirochaetota bacterium]
MKKLFIKATILICLPIILNIAITVYCYSNRSIPEFKGYFLGTLLSMFFSLVWIFIARKAIVSNIMVMFTVTLASFPIKIVFLAIIALGGLFFLGMDQIFFGGAFLLGTILSLFIEVWFLISANKLQRKLKSAIKPPQGQN